jgi:arginyl-tRNA synthetase
MLSFDGATAPYLQYAHARICSIFRRAGLSRESVRGEVPVLDDDRERALALRLLQFGSAFHDALDRRSPHRLCTYALELAGDFTSFYEGCPVLRAGDETRMRSRLALCDATASTIAAALDLLGIGAPEEM